MKVFPDYSSDVLSVRPWRICHLYLCVLFWGELLCLVQDRAFYLLIASHFEFSIWEWKWDHPGYTWSNSLSVEACCCLYYVCRYWH